MTVLQSRAGSGVPLATYASYALLALGSLSFVVSSVFFLGGTVGDRPAIVGYAFSFFVFVLSERIFSIFEAHSAMQDRRGVARHNLQRLDKIEQISLADRDLQYLGPARKVLDHMMDDLEKSNCVRHTFVGIGRQPAYNALVRPLYETFFEHSGGKWYDLTSLNEAFDTRFQMNLDATRVGDRHVIAVLRHNVPLINFTLIYRDDRPYVIYIGWDYRSDSADAPIFVGRSDRLLRHFEKYFDFLWEHKTLRAGKQALDYNRYRTDRLSGINLVNKV